MAADESLPTVVADQRRSYQWYIDYDRSEEYDKDPEWATDTHTKTVERDGADHTRFYDPEAPETVWLRSDTVYNLMRCR